LVLLVVKLMVQIEIGELRAVEHGHCQRGPYFKLSQGFMESAKQ